MIRILLTLLLLATAGGCASQHTPTPVAANRFAVNQKPDKVTDPKSPDAVTCRNVVQTGSRFTTRYCMKNRDWKARERATQAGAQEEMNHVEMGALQGPNGGE